MECPNCKSTVKFFELLKINNKNPYSCPVCFRKSAFKHDKRFLNLVAGIAGLGGVILFYSLKYYEWIPGLLSLIFVIVVFVVVFLKYAKLELVAENEK